jgi:hypothetical protein
MKSEGKMEWGYTIKQILIIKKHSRLQQNDLPLWLDPMLHMPEEQH